MNRTELLEKVIEWKTNHPNNYGRDIYEDVYWTMFDLQNILSQENISDETVEVCENIFNRFKHKYR